MATKNPFGKARKPGNAYVTLIDQRTGWKYEVLKLWQGRDKSLSDPYARAFCNVHGFATEMGDCYVRDVPGLRAWLAAQTWEV